MQFYQDFEIIVVDQCSKDWSFEEIKNLYKKEIKDWKIKTIKNYENNWFSWWNNFWVNIANKNSKYICLLNNDTVVPQNWLGELIKWIESDKNLWAISCPILDKWCRDEIINKIYNKKKKQISTIFWESVYNNMTIEEITSNLYYTTTLSWCCFLYKKDIVDIPFPEYYFAYAEDVYLSWYIINLWYKLWVTLNTYVDHYWSWSFWYKPSFLKLFHWNKNQIINYLLFYPLFYKILLFPLFFIKELAHLFMWYPFMRIKAKVKWWLRIMLNYKDIKLTKKHIKNNKKISSYDFISKLSFKLSDFFFMKSIFFKFILFLWNWFFYLYWLIAKNIFYFINLII